MPIFVVWQLSIAFLLAFVIVVFFIITRSRRTILYISRYLAILTAIAGFSVYTIGYLQPDFLASEIPGAAMRAVVSTIGMLFLSTDYLSLSAWLAESIWREILFWGIHLAAFIVIQAAFISLFGRRIQDYCRLRFGFHKELYIIHGCTKNAIMLGEDIAGQNEKNNKKGKTKRDYSKSLVVFLLNEEDDSKKTYEKVMHFGGIVQVLDSKHNLSAFLHITGLGKRYRKNRVYNSVFMPNEMFTVRDVKIIVDFANEANTKWHNSVLPDNLRIYVLTSCDLERTAIEDITQKKSKVGLREYPYYFRIHSEEGLLAGQIIKKKPPFNSDWFSFDKPYEFSVLVLGFGTMGTSALLQILRNVQLDGSKVRVLIADKDIHLVDYFKRRYPMINKLCCNIESINMDVRADECVITTVNNNKPDYIIVSYGDDKENLELAYDISKCYSKSKHNPAPVIAVSQKYGHKEDYSEDMYGVKILFFGNEREIYKKNVIINEDNDNMAKALFSSYREQESSDEFETIKLDSKKVDEEWNKLDWVSQESERASAEFIRGILNLIAYNESNKSCFDEPNWNDKLKERLAITEHMRWCAFHATMGFDLIKIDELETRFDELKRSGCSDEDALVLCRKDVKNRLHACLVEWDELDVINAEYIAIAKKTVPVSNNSENDTDSNYTYNRDFKQEYRKIINRISKIVDMPDFKRLYSEVQTKTD